ncbi:hypothetical protein FRC06_004459 [Ceratobasidium sp. 370]|nr:hypothetical protein FRC06_004459 [Ceratobasidium sp. 370]
MSLQIHGDIKSANVLISSEGVAKLADFGCTELKKSTLRFFVQQYALGNNCVLLLSKAPEILKGLEERSQPADVYALGMTLLEVVTGRVPFSDKQDMAVITAVCIEQQVPNRPKGFPSFEENEANLLWGVLLSCWAYEPSGRPDSGTVKAQPHRKVIDAQNKGFTNLYGLIIGIDRHGISDGTLSALIRQLSKAKGDNITIIIDSCHSGGTTGGHDQETHVLLSACKNDEIALEIPCEGPDESISPPSSGVFTKALLIALRECDLATTSYSSLLRGVQKHMVALMAKVAFGYKMVVPQCEGRNQDRLLFRTRFAFTKGAIQLDRGRRHNEFRIKAGSASGIQQGTNLGVYAGDMPRTSPPIARLVAIQVNATVSMLRVRDADPSVEIPEHAYVFVTKYAGHPIRILVDNRLKISPLWQEVLGELRSKPINIVWSKLPDEPSSLVLVPSEEGIIVQRQDPSVIQLWPEDIILGRQMGSCEVARKLSAIAQFHFHLQRRNPESPLRGRVGMKLIELKAKPSRAWGVKEYVPISANPDNLFGDGLSNGTVELQSAPDKRYGLQLTNTSNWPLFAWVLCFNLDDYSIKFIYRPARSGSPPLSTGGKELAVGYGDAGVKPLLIHNSGSSDRESGVIMLFVSNTWADMSHLEQPSIFEPMSGARAWNEEGDSPKEWPSVFEPAGDTSIPNEKRGLVNARVDIPHIEESSFKLVGDNEVRSRGARPAGLGSDVWDILAVGVSISSSKLV